MKKIFLILIAIFFTVNMLAQSPEKISYQAVIRDASNSILTEQTIGMQISIIQGSANGIAVYVETQNTTTNSNGLICIEIGEGTSSDDFSSIDWSNGPYFIKTEIDPIGGNTYTITGTSQLLSVPYAFHAKTADSVTSLFSVNYNDIKQKPNIKDSINAYNDTTSQFLREEIDGSTTNELQTLSLTKDTLTISGSNFIILEKKTPIIWSGGCSHHGTASGYNTYCTDRTDINTIDGYLSVDTNGVFTVLKSGYYRINMSTISQGSSSANMQLLVNGITVHKGFEFANDNWTDNFMDITWRFETGHSFYIAIFNPGIYAYHSYSTTAGYSRLQVSYEGPLE